MEKLEGKALEAAILNEVSRDEMWKHMEFFCGFDRTSGTENEFRAVDYIVRTLQSYGAPVEVHEFESYLSYPISARLVVFTGGPREVRAKTRSFSASTPADGIEGEIVYIPGGRDMFRDYETRRRLEQLDLRGKIVLSEGGGRQNMIAAQRLGAVGYIHMWPSDEDYIHEGIVSPVWGTPTPDSAGTIPQIPVVSVTHNDGLALKAMAEREPVRVRLYAKTETGWRKQLLPVATIAGETDQYVLAAGHLDSWHIGATDNATGNACCLELARIAVKYSASLRRGVKVAWWPGHSTGRYAGSTWYADNFWQDLHDNCITYINIDSPGPLGATDYSLVTAVSENAAFATGLVRELTGQDVKWERPVRAGDQSFWGPGISSLFMLLSNRPPEQQAAVGGSGMGWWWHTEMDTLDKVDPGVLVLDTKIHALAITRLCSAKLLPFDLGALGRELEEIVSDIQARAGAHFDLRPVLRKIREFQDAGTRIREKGEKLVAAGASSKDLDAVNAATLRAIKILTPVNYTAVGPFDHDPAVPSLPVPVLQPAARLAGMDPESNEYRFLRTKLVRERNKVVHALQEAIDELNEAT